MDFLNQGPQIEPVLRRRMGMDGIAKDGASSSPMVVVSM